MEGVSCLGRYVGRLAVELGGWTATEQDEHGGIDGRGKGEENSDL